MCAATKSTSSNAASGQPSSIEVKLRQHTSSDTASSRAASRRRYTTEIPHSIFACIAETTSAKRSSAMVPISPPPIPVSSNPSDKTVLSEFEQVFSKVHRRRSQNSSQDSQVTESSIGDVVLSAVASKTSDTKWKACENLSKIAIPAKNGSLSQNPAPLSPDPGKECLKPRYRSLLYPAIRLPRRSPKCSQ